VEVLSIPHSTPHYLAEPKSKLHHSRISRILDGLPQPRAVIARRRLAARQSILLGTRMDCHLASAPRNDDGDGSHSTRVGITLGMYPMD
jgi:hypothetical protein